MTEGTIYENDGYSKKELIEIIGQIDADRNQIKHQADKPDSDKEGAYLSWARDETR